MRSAVAVIGVAVLSLVGVGSVGRVLAHGPLDPRTRIGKPGHVVHSHDGTRAYRANGARRGISVLDPRTLHVVREIAVEESVDLVALSQDGQWLYGISPRASHIIVIETATDRIVGRLPLRSP
jgi:DNA-binding beta-propeller fold protein YncE